MIYHMKNKRKHKWKAYIGVNGKNIHIGYFDNLDDALLARKSFELSHNYHNNRGR